MLYLTRLRKEIILKALQKFYAEAKNREERTMLMTLIIDVENVEIRC